MGKSQYLMSLTSYSDVIIICHSSSGFRINSVCSEPFLYFKLFLNFILHYLPLNNKLFYGNFGNKLLLNNLIPSFCMRRVGILEDKLL